MRRLFFILALYILALIAVACGGSPTPTLMPAPTTSGSEPTEAGLQSRAESKAKAQSDGKWAEWYEFLSTDSTSGCSEADFSAAAEFGMSSFRELK